jgi:hypothetical protein
MYITKLFLTIHYNIYIILHVHNVTYDLFIVDKIPSLVICICKMICIMVCTDDGDIYINIYISLRSYCQF